jgi:hypothetical protein
VAQQLRILQSVWAMERRRADVPEWPLQTKLEMIRDAGYDGAGVRFIDPAFTAPYTAQCRSNLVSGSRLRKTGISQILLRDYRRSRSEIVQFWSIETEGKSAESRHWRGFLGLWLQLSWVE